MEDLTPNPIDPKLNQGSEFKPQELPKPPLPPQGESEFKRQGSDKPPSIYSNKEPIKPPLQPVDTKKIGAPPVQIFVLVILGFGLAAAGFAFFSKSILEKNSAKAKAKVEIPKPQTVVEEVKTVAPLLSATGTESKEPPAAELPLPTLSLSGIVFSEQGSYALINGRVVPEGGTIEGAKLEKVSSDKIEMSFDGRKFVLRSR